MNSYTVTITPDDGQGAETVVKLDINGSAPRIKELRLTAGENTSLSTGQLPAINLELLLAAVMPTAAPKAVTATPPTIATVPTARVVAPDAPTAIEPAAAVSVPTAATPRARAKAAPPRAQVNATPPRARAKATPTAGATQAKTAPGKNTAPTKKSAAKKVTGTKRTPAATASKAQAGDTTKTGRVYRTMPDDFAGTYGKTTMADLADVYRVPLHTIQGWVNTARKQGKIPPARSRNKA